MDNDNVLEKIGMSEEEFERQYQVATKRGEETLKNSPKALRAKFDRKNRRLIVDLHNGATFIVPVNLVQIFQNASDAEIADVQITVKGLYLSWEKLDEDLTVSQLVSGVFGTPKWMNSLQEHLAEIGRKGGTSRSDAKRKASAENGKKGGRPKKVA